MIYQFKSGNTYRGANAQAVGEELERIRNANCGKLETGEVVRWAADPTSPLHSCFTWDNERAAQAYRLDEARSLIRMVVVIRDETGPPEPAFWNVSVNTTVDGPDGKGERYYQASHVLETSPVEFAAALQGMLRELSSAQNGLAQLRRIAPRGRKMLVGRASKNVEAAHQALEQLV